MREQDKSMNEPEEFAEVERQLRRLEPPPPELDRDALMYRAGWAAALAQQPARGWTWMAPAAGGFLAATAAGLLAMALWRPAFSEPGRDGIAQTPVANENEEIAESPHTSPLADNFVPEENNGTGTGGVPRVAPSVVLVDQSRRPGESENNRSLAADEAAPAVRGTDAWGIFSTALAERHGVRWEGPWQREGEGESMANATPPPTVMQMMREAGAWPEPRGSVPLWYPLM